ncbi:MAG: glutamine--fructose-6-phosphate transaminase (isomerizing) [Patescibacteria group bacterium]
MCGIYAITSQKSNTAERVFKGLQILEYRGYDSWGIAARTNSQKFERIRHIGKISDSACEVPESSESLGHTRWATCGEVSEANTHPHTSGSITLVHNGIVENFQSLKEELESLGYFFVSHTDSEVLAGLIDYSLKDQKNKLKALQSVVEKIEGRSSVVFAIQGERGMYAFTTGLALVVGFEEEESMIASDPMAFTARAQEVVYMEPGQAGYFNTSQREFYNLDTGEVVYPSSEKWALSDTPSSEKACNEHYMLREIMEQKKLVRKVMEQSECIAQLGQAIKNAKQVYLTGCGTAHKVAMLGAYYLHLCGIDAKAVVASEIDEYLGLINKDTLCIAISQSGETADVLCGIERVQAQGAEIAAITNVAHSSLARKASTVLPIYAGAELAVASTKACMNQIAVLYQVACSISKNIPSTDQDALEESLAYILSDTSQDAISYFAQSISSIREIFLIGSGAYYPLALEGAIKIAEVSYINAQGFATGELKHGPLALIEKGRVCIVLGSEAKDLRAAAQMRARGAYIVGIAVDTSPEFDIHIPSRGEGFIAHMSTLAILQLLSYHLSLARGINPDRPRNLAKSVTVQ